ncbi:M1 family metallopeptidase [Lutispora thermophila]|uniref:Peptidase family M1 n=1 Tax=Lutispora thermophila DSM 19022 TaxID=1122184 RepID=A0A1M6EJ05_9FIRM|nr:M1 family metallopeptidase [Lutispora thermophila]SHI85310.1 Peptidase family M1 [Lutispora thermophila DSM 19022]
MKPKLKLLPLFLVLVFVVSGCLSQKEAAPVLQMDEIEARSYYNIEAELNVDEKTLTAVEEINYYNNDNIEMKELYFHVYPNAFKTKETAPFLFDDFDNAYKRGFESGYAEIISVKKKNTDGEKLLKYFLSGEGDTILKIELDSSLKPYERVKLIIEFALKIPPAGERFGYGDNNFNLGNWYPVAAVYDQKDGWNLDKYYAIGDPFYSDAADYRVAIKTPEEYIVAASGKLVEEIKEENGKIKRVYEGKALRDFAFVANNNFAVIEEEVDGVKVMSYYYKEDKVRGEEALEYGVKSIRLFSQIYGKYPYPVYSVVETEFPSGMEYPALVYISDKYYKPTYSSDPLIITVVHETAHQWFYGIVGNDQVDEAWLDESFAAFSETIFIERTYGKKTGRDYYTRSIENSVEEAMSSQVIDGKVVKSLSEFQNWDDYGPTVYERGAQMLNKLRETLGEDMFLEIVRAYVEKYKFKIATTGDFVKVCEEVSGKDLTEFFKPWISNVQ